MRSTFRFSAMGWRNGTEEIIYLCLDRGSAWYWHHIVVTLSNLSGVWVTLRCDASENSEKQKMG